VRYLSNVNREGLWALSVTSQALSRNTHICAHLIANQVSGPVTANLLYETVTGVGVIAASGSAMTTGPRTAGGKLNDYMTPLECRFVGEVSHAASGIEPEQMNEICKAILPKYEDSIKTPDIGKPFQEAYDIDLMEPIPEWEDIYLRVKEETDELGISC